MGTPKELMEEVYMFETGIIDWDWLNFSAKRNYSSKAVWPDRTAFSIQASGPVVLFMTSPRNNTMICTYFCPILWPVGIKNIVADEYSL